MLPLQLPAAHRCLAAVVAVLAAERLLSLP
jgi:hypothetical protein